MADQNGGVERLPDPPDPGGRGPQPTSRERQNRAAEDVAAQLDVDREGIGTVDRIAGLDVFLRSEGTEQFGTNVASEFASEADFVQANDIDPNVDAQAITAAPVVSQSRRDDVATRAREQTAADTEFVQPTDLSVEVGARGVSQLQTDPDRRDDIAARARDATAADAQFIQPADLDVTVTDAGVEGVQTDPERRDDIAARARQATAEDAQFIQPADLDVDVGEEGISDIGTDPDRRDDIAARARQATAEDVEYATPADFSVDVGELGVTDIGLTDQGERRRASRQFEADTPLEDVDPASDISSADSGGFRLSETAERRSAARRFEDDYDALGQGELTASAVRDTDSGFGLARDPAREVAAARLDSQYPDVDIAPGDIELSLGGDGAFDASFEREVQNGA